jgi:transcriptional regulator with XRE-family HTH domain
MYVRNLHLLMLKRGLTQSELARLLGISRQAVSLWFRSETDFVNIHTKHLNRLCEVLNVASHDLLTPFPEMEESRDYNTLFLWDRMYKNLDAFYIALANREWRSIARLVQVVGVYRSAKILGKTVWDDFSNYSQFIHPGKRKICEALCLQHKNPV